MRTPLLLTPFLVVAATVTAAAEPTVTALETKVDRKAPVTAFWSHDGARLYLVASDALYEVDPATGAQTRREAEAVPSGPLPPRALSAKGDRLVFRAGLDLVVLALDTGKATRQPVHAWGLAIQEPQWAADDRTVVGWVEDEHGNGSIVVATPDDGGSRAVTCRKHDHISFARLTGDGKKLLFVHDGDVFVTDLACKKPKKLSFAGWAKTLDVSPDGKTIAVTRDAGAGAGARVQVGKLTGKPVEASKDRMLTTATFVSRDVVYVEDLGALGSMDGDAVVPRLYSIPSKRLTAIPVEPTCDAYVVAAAPASGKALLSIACAGKPDSLAIMTP